MIDLHCHILPGIDDGPRNEEESVRMAEMAEKDGITHIVATPHFLWNGTLDHEMIGDSLVSFRARVLEKDIRVKLLAGADIKLTYEAMKRIEKGDLPTIDGSRYFLLELPDPVPPNVDNFLFSAGMKGYKAIITHPERNKSLQSSPEKMDKLRASGALFQLTAMSITGEFGSQVEAFSRFLLKKGFVDFVASDAHDSVRRKPLLSKAYGEVLRSFREKAANRIFFANPEAVLANGELRTAA